MKKIITSIVFCLSIFGCVSKAEYEKLKTENTLLRAELIDLKESAPKLLANIKLAFDSNQFESAKSFFKQLQEKHPESDEYKEAILYIEKINEAEALENKKKEQEKAAQIAELERLEAEKLKSLNKLRKKFDDVSGVTWYENPYFTHYTNSNGVSVYMGKTDERQPWLRLFMSYSASDWLFFKRAYLSYEGNTLEISFDEYQNKKTDHSGGEIWEWIDITADESTIKFLWAYANGKEPKVRYVGTYTKTRSISNNEKQGIKDVLLGYMALTGKAL